MNESTGKNIGIYPEIKNPGFHKHHGKDISKIVLEILKKYGYSKKSDACILQCFDAKELQVRIKNLIEQRKKLLQQEFYRKFPSVSDYKSIGNLYFKIFKFFKVLKDLQ